uniref:Uncharacterized protein n=1 Tax=Clytia hemisphaerica TaxID=252671 RepID=A0A7M5V0H6_9CNID
MRLPKLYQAILFAVVVVLHVRAQVPQPQAAYNVAAYRREAESQPSEGDICPAKQFTVAAKGMLAEIFSKALKRKTDEEVDFEEKGCKGERCFAKLFTKLTCRCELRSDKNEATYSKRWARTIYRKLVKKNAFLKSDAKLNKETEDLVVRVLCKVARDMRNQYCDSLTGKDDKDKNKDDDNRDKEKEDKKKEDQHKDHEDCEEKIDEIQDDKEKEKIKKKEEAKQNILAKCLDATQTVIAFSKQKPKEPVVMMEPVPMVGGPGSLPPQEGKSRGIMSRIKNKLFGKKKPKIAAVAPAAFKPQPPKIVGGPDSIPPFLKKHTKEDEPKEPEAASLPVIDAVKGVRNEINKFLAALEAAGHTTMFEVRFYVDVAKCFKALLDEASKALDDDPAAAKIVENMCHTFDLKIRQYFIDHFRGSDLKTRKLIYQIFSFNNREFTQPIVNFINELEDESSDDDDEDDDHDHPEIFDSDVIILCQEPRLRGIVCYNIDVTKCDAKGVLEVAKMNIQFKSIFVPPGMLVRIKRDGKKRNINGLRGIGVWSHRKRFNAAIEINTFTKGQFKQMNGDDDDPIKFGDDSITIETEIDDDEENEEPEPKPEPGPAPPEPEPPAPAPEPPAPAPAPEPEPAPVPEPEPEPEIPYECRDTATVMNSDGRGNAVYLDRHDVNCADGEAIAGFKLQRKSGGGKYQIKYKCCKTPVAGTSKQISNPFTDDGGGGMVYLDRQNIDCKNSYLNQFKLNRKPGGGKYRFMYTCVDIPGEKQCQALTTTFNSDGGGKGNTVYLDRHDVKCPDQTFLSQWKIKRDGKGDNVRFEFSCCKGAPAPAPEPEPAPKPGPPEEPTKPEADIIGKPDRFNPSTNNLLGTIDLMKKEFTFTFDIKPNKKLAGWRKILHINNNGKPCCAVGSRIPGIWFNSNSYRMHICFAINGKGNDCWNDPKDLPEKKFSNIKIEQSKEDGKYIFRIYKDGEEVFKKDNTKGAQEFKDAKLYGSFGGGTFANVDLKGVVFQNSEPEKPADESKKEGGDDNEDDDEVEEEEEKEDEEEKDKDDDKKDDDDDDDNEQPDPEDPKKPAEPSTGTDTDKEVDVKKGNIIGKIAKIKKEFSISVEIKPSDVVNDEANIIILTDNDKKNKLGTPGIYFEKNKLELRVCMAGLHKNMRDCHKTKEIPKDKFTNVVVKQVQRIDDKYQFYVLIDGKESQDSIKINDKPTVYENVEMSASGKDTTPAKAVIKDVQFNNVEDDDDDDESDKDKKPKNPDMDPIEFPGEIKPKKNLPIAKVPVVKKEFMVSFDIKPLAKTGGWTNVFRIQQKGHKDCCSYGDRIPAVFMRPGDTRLHISYSVSGAGNRFFDTARLAIGKYHKVVIQQRKQINGKYRYSIDINGREVYQQENTKTADFKDCLMWASDGFYKAGNAMLKNIVFQNLEPREGPKDGDSFEQEKEYEPKKNNAVAGRSRQTKDFLISFEVKPIDKEKSWANIFRVTNKDKNCCQVGLRAPAVWFRPNSMKLHICMAINGNGNLCFNSKELPKGKYTKVEIKQELKYGNRYRYSVEIDDEEVYTITNTKAQVFENPKLYIGDAFYNAPKATIKNFKWINIEPPKPPVKPPKPYDWYGINEPTDPKRNNFIMGIPIIKKEFSLQLDIKPTNEKVKAWSNIMRISADPTNNCCKVGARIPGIWFNPNSRRLHITFAIGNNGNVYYNSPELPPNKIARIGLQQVKQFGNNYRYSITLNGKEVFQKPNPKAREFKKAKLYVSDEYYAPAKVKIIKLKFQNTEPSDEDAPAPGEPFERDGLWTIARNTYIGSFNLKKEWSVSFDIKPRGTIAGWTNIIHLTSTGKNCCGKGDRIPAIWFNSRTTKMHVCSQIDNAGNRCFNANPIPLNKWSAVVIKQDKDNKGKYIYTITVAGKVLKRMENKKPQEYKNVRIFTADNFYREANAELKNLEIRNLVDPPKPPPPPPKPVIPPPPPQPPIQDPEADKDIKNKGKDCWRGCGAKGGPCPQWCGKDGYCCRQGWGKDRGCNKATAACKGFHCCTPISEPPAPPPEDETKELKNKGKNCWGGCGKGGPCPQWCGRDGYCCRQGWGGKKGDPGCNKAISACKNFHCCTLINDKASDPIVPPAPAPVVPAKEEKELRNKGKDCWRGCGKGGPCPQWCGKDGYCCRQGWGGSKDPGCKNAVSPCKNFHCCTLIKEPAPPPAPEEETKEEEEGKEISNKGKDCWGGCGAKGGACPQWCGKDGFCCRQGYANKGCENALSACNGFHCCTAVKEVAPVQPPPAPPAPIVDDDDEDDKKELKNKGKDCWGGCGAKGGACPQWCGKDGYCCRQGWGGDKDCEKARTPCKGFHCCTLIDEVKPAPDAGDDPDEPKPVDPKPPPPQPAKWRCTLQYTPFNDEGKGKNFYLDRHMIACKDNQAVKRLRLRRNGKGKYRYEFTCCDLPVKCQKHNKKATGWNDAGNGNAVYLDRHDVNVGSEAFLSALKLNRNGPNKIRYNFDACVIPDKKSCYSARTVMNDDGSGNTVYLDRHNIECRSNYGIQRLKLVRNSKGNKYQYHFTCCTVKEIIQRPEPVKPEPPKPIVKPEPFKPDEPEVEEPEKPKPDDSVTDDDKKKLEKSKMVTKIPKVGKQWAVSFDVKQIAKAPGWTNIIHLSARENCCQVGDRVPAVWFWADSSKLHICFPVDDQGNTCFNKVIDSGKFVTVSIEQRKYESKYKTVVTIAGEQVYTKEHKTEPKEFNDVKLWAADPWHNAANAEIQNLEFKNIEDDDDDDKEDAKEEEEQKEEEEKPKPGPKPAEPPAPKPQPIKWVCINKMTPWNDEGKGKSFYLDRHNVRCDGDQVLKRFKLGRNGKGKYKYDYKCCDPQMKASVTKETETPLNADGGGNMVYLDRHAIDCGNGLISQYKLNRNGGKIQYKYTCKMFTGKRSCYDGSTPMNLDGGGNTVYLDRHNVRCKVNYGLSFFKLYRNDKRNRVAYKYRCCTFLNKVVKPDEDKPEPPAPAPPPADADAEMAKYLDGQIISLKSFHNKIVAAEKDGSATANRKNVGAWEKFKVQVVSGSKIGIMSLQWKKYLVAEANGEVNANRPKLGGWETFDVEKVSDTKIGLKTAHGKYVIAFPNGQLKGTAKARKSWEEFEVGFPDGRKGDDEGDKDKEDPGKVPDPDQEEPEPEKKDDSIGREEETKLEKNKIVGTIPKVNKEWSLSFDIKPLDVVKKASSSIVHLTASDKNCCAPGDRIPGVFMIRNRIELLVCSDKDGKGNRCIKSGKLTKGKYSSVLIQQRKTKKGRYIMTVTINGKINKNRIVFSKDQEPKEYTDVKMYSADKWYQQANAFVKNLIFSTQDIPDPKEDADDDKEDDDDKKDDEDADKPGDKGTDEEPDDKDEGDKEEEPEDKIEVKPEAKLKKGNLIGTIEKMKKEWRLSFDLKINKKAPRDQNIIHLTSTDKNCCKPGDRIPYISLYTNQKIRVCSQRFGKGNKCLFSKNKLPLNKYVSILVEQTKVKEKYVLTVTVGGVANRVRIGDEKQEPIEFETVKIYAADKFYQTADGSIKDFLYANLDSSDLSEDEKDKEEEKEEEPEDKGDDEKEEEDNKEKEGEEDKEKETEAEDEKEPDQEPDNEEEKVDPNPEDNGEKEEEKPEEPIDPNPEVEPGKEEEKAEEDKEKEDENKDQDATDKVNPTEDDDDKWQDKISVREICLSARMKGCKIRSRRSLKIFIPKGVKALLQQFCQGRKGTLPDLTFCGRITLDFNQGKLAQYNKIKIITFSKNGGKLPITQDEEPDEKEDREQQEKEDEAGKQEDKEKDEKEGKDEDDVDDDVELPHDNAHLMRACDAFKRTRCVYAKDLNTIKTLAQSAGLKITWIFIPAGTYLPVEELLIPKPQPGQPQCNKQVGKIQGPVRVLLTELDAAIKEKHNPTLVCSNDQEIQAAKAVKKAARRSFIERYNNGLNTWNKAINGKPY